MPYLQRFGLSRLSPLNMTEKEEEKNPASEIIEDNNNKSNQLDKRPSDTTIEVKAEEIK